MNQALFAKFGHRSIESLKKQRQKSQYKEKVQIFLTRLRDSNGPTNNNSVTSSEQVHQSEESTGSNAEPVSSEAGEASTFNELTPSFDRVQVQESTVEPTPVVDPILSHLLSLEELSCDSYKVAYLNDIIAKIKEDSTDSGKFHALLRLSAYLDEIFPPRRRQSRRKRNPVIPRFRNRRALRKHQYATTQRLWYVNKSRCIKGILDGAERVSQPPRAIMEPYWQNVFEQSSDSAPPLDDLKEFARDGIWRPIVEIDVTTSKPSATTSPGYDGITAREIRAVPPAIICRMMNIMLWCGAIPKRLRVSKTIFIPKKADASLPEDFRPITMPPILVRWFHSILAERLSKCIQFERSQRGFMASDGCAENTTMIDLLLRENLSNYTSCFIAVLDVSKAFDSVSHRAILGTLESYGLGEGLIQYVRKLYEDASVFLSGDTWESSTPIYPGRGVKQGDSLSPVLFNMIIDRLIRKLPPEIGCRIGNKITNNAAYADDLVIWASTPQGLQKLIDIVDSFLQQCGLSLNSAKCFSVSVKGQPKQKRAVIEQRSFNVGGRTIPSLKRTEEWKYLGIKFTAEGKTKVDIVGDLTLKLDRLTRAPLKPQQRLFALRTYLLPQFYHIVSLGNIMVGVLRKVDKVVRMNIRKWLCLPPDAPNAYFHASIEDGGLGVVSLRWAGPLMRYRRLCNLQIPTLEGVSSADHFIASEVAKVVKRLHINNSVALLSDIDIKKYWADCLHASVDGHGLRLSFGFKHAHQWLGEPTKLLSGRDFVNISRLRINALPTRSRCSRGRHHMDRRCRKGCDAQETLYHVVQACKSTATDRNFRHDSIVNFVQRNLRNRGFSVEIEYRVQTTDGIRKPDIIASKAGEVYVIDVQVVSDYSDISRLNRIKADKYHTPGMVSAIEEIFHTEKVHFCALTITWRGVWCRDSINKLVQLGIIKGSDSKLISTRVLIGGVMIHRNFMMNTHHTRTSRTRKSIPGPRSIRSGIG